MAYEYAKVCLTDDIPYTLDREFDYYIPAQMRSGVCRGAFVTVPFGRGNRRRLGIVTGISEQSATPESRLKPIDSVCPDSMSLSEELLGLCRFLKEQTLCTIGDAVHAMIPAAAMSRLVEFYRPVPEEFRPDSEPARASREEEVLAFIRARGRVTEAALRTQFGPRASESAAKLIKSGHIERGVDIKPGVRAAYRETVSLALDRESAQAALDRQKGAVPLRSEGQRRVVELLMGDADGEPEGRTVCDEAAHPTQTTEPQKNTELPNNTEPQKSTGPQKSTEPQKDTEPAGRPESLPEYDLAALCAAAGVNRAQLKVLIDRGVVKLTKTEVYRERYAGLEDNSAAAQSARAGYTLNDEQSTALEGLWSLASSGKGAAALLHGVTGSGKTCVMVGLIDRVLASGRSVILLLPEIALTPQSVSIFCARYGDRVALIHSGLSAGERLDAYNKIRRGEADLVVGTRSAVFSPVRNLGLIIIDEEQEHTYKSDSDPKYHARDVARYRCAHGDALLLLCSATPSVESYHKAVEGKYSLFRMTHRYGGTALPRVELADMREEAQVGNIDPLGQVLTTRLRETLSEGGQAVLFLNRRGYNNFVSCRTCGAAIKCPRCSVALHYHATPGHYDDGVLVCHWCGHRQKQPAACPECGSPHLVRMGYGTQRLERDLSELIPEARVLRMDADTTGEKSAYDSMLTTFRAHGADILLGTQMVTKGHDFPDVTLAGVLLADASLYLDDYRANERTFAMLTQIVGRAGRRSKPGVAVIQTNNPDNDVIRLACAQDYEKFFENEIKLRRLLVFPPFCDIALLTLTSSDERELLEASNSLAAHLAERLGGDYSDVPTVVFGPMEAPVYRVDGKYRTRMVIKCRLNKRSRALFAELMTACSAAGGPTLSIDFNPSGL